MSCCSSVPPTGEYGAFARLRSIHDSDNYDYFVTFLRQMPGYGELAPRSGNRAGGGSGRYKDSEGIYFDEYGSGEEDGDDDDDGDVEVYYDDDDDHDHGDDDEDDEGVLFTARDGGRSRSDGSSSSSIGVLAWDKDGNVVHGTIVASDLEDEDDDDDDDDDDRS
jgi:hypothetical protein